jgi:AcrR family transcriptional regulator
MSDEPREAVMRATYRALCAHGYANLTMQDIADEADLSKAALHYHYDTKRDLLTAFLDSLTSWYEGRLTGLEGETPRERLAALFDECLCVDTTGSDVDADTDTDANADADTDYPAFHTALLEVKAQAPYEEAYRDRLAAADEVLFDRVEEIVADGVATGQFREVDPEATAALVVDVLTGAHTRNVAVGRPLDESRELLDRYVAEHLLADGTGGDHEGRTSREAGEDREDRESRENHEGGDRSTDGRAEASR